MKHNLKRAGAALLLILLSMLGYLCGLLDSPDRFITDHVYTSLRSANPRIFIIGIDDETLDRYGPWGSWSRQLTADLITYLNEDEAVRPAVIGIDILFTGNTTDREDGALVEAAKDGGNIVFASQAAFSQKRADSQGRADSNILKYEEPFDALRSVATFGLMNVFTDQDSVVRKGIDRFSFDGRDINSLSGEVARVYAKDQGIELPPSPPLDSNGQWVIPFAAQPGEFFGINGKGTSWVRVMDGEIPRELFADSIVLVGPYTTGLLDSFFTSADRRDPMYGVEIHANMLQARLEGTYKRQVPGIWSVLFVTALSFLLYAGFCTLRLRTSTLLTIGVCAAYFMAAVWIYQAGWILPIFYPLLTFLLLYLVLLVTSAIILTMEKASLYDQMHHLFINSIRTIANAIDAKDPCTSGHCQRVAEYSLLIGRALRCGEEDLADLEYAALLHDVGKIGVSDSILKKNGPLTDEEYAEMKTHPKQGAQILGEIQEFRGRITDGARYHHERYDGRGYCEGIGGKEIPLFGRIIAIADSYDAMTQNRPYHFRMPREKAIEELRRNMGTQFDPELVPLFIEMLEQTPEPSESGPAEPDNKPGEQAARP